MLFANGERTLGGGRLAWSIAFGGRFWWIVVERTGLVLDTRWASGAKEASRPNACVYLLLEGEIELISPHPGKVSGPAAMILTEEQLEGANGARGLTYRASGEPFLTLQIHFPKSMLAAEPPANASDPPVPLTLGHAAWEAAREVVATSKASLETSDAPMQTLVKALIAEGVVKAEASRPLVTKTPAPLELLWKGIRPMVERLYLTPTVEEVSTATGISVRQVDRYVSQFLARFGHLGGSGWRMATRHMRLKLAVLWLSADGVSVADVAAATSYGSPDAMARAFRDAGLPTPSKLQSELRNPVRGTDEDPKSS
ncbi:MAG TPA: AraC family transcriptional regulator [Polyangiaceae bacterium]